jgi:Rrf2 family transcriptional regulator, iron-sulfur cluster assembly transcription factor
MIIEPTLWRILSSTAGYAVRATAYVSEHSEDGHVAARDIADALGVPPNYLGKVLGTLARAGILESVRGMGGGFRLAQPASDTTLAMVIAPFDSIGSRPQCLLRDTACRRDNPCIAHAGWTDLADRLHGYFLQTTISDLLHLDRAS